MNDLLYCELGYKRFDNANARWRSIGSLSIFKSGSIVIRFDNGQLRDLVSELGMCKIKEYKPLRSSDIDGETKEIL